MKALEAAARAMFERNNAKQLTKLAWDDLTPKARSGWVDDAQAALSAAEAAAWQPGLPEAEVHKAFRERSELEIEVNNLRARIRDLEAKNNRVHIERFATEQRAEKAKAELAIAHKFMDRDMADYNALKEERDAIEAKTIERLAQKFEDDGEPYVARKLRALKPSEERQREGKND